MNNYESPEVQYNGLYWTVGNWTFDEEDLDLSYIDDAIRAWSALRAYVIERSEDDVIDR